MIKGFEGAIAYANPSPGNPLPEEAARDGTYEHIHDALGYGLLNIVALQDDGLLLKRPGTGKVRVGGGMRQPVSSMNLMENRQRHPNQRRVRGLGLRTAGMRRVGRFSR